jgi:hypothetical protein
MRIGRHSIFLHYVPTFCGHSAKKLNTAMVIFNMDQLTGALITASVMILSVSLLAFCTDAFSYYGQCIEDCNDTYVDCANNCTGDMLQR